MTLSEFLQLPEPRQAQLIWEGVFLGTREEGDTTLLLYKVEDFYCEVVYNREDNGIVMVQAFGDKRRLEPYFGLNPN